VGLRVFARRTHLGHGYAKRSPHYSFVERVVDESLFETFEDIYTCLASGTSPEYCLPPQAAELYRRVVEETGDYYEAEERADELAHQILGEEACRIAEDRGVACFTVPARSAMGTRYLRPVFVGDDTVYVTGWWGGERDPDTGAAHPTLFRFERRLPMPQLRRLVEKVLGRLSDEGELEELVREWAEARGVEEWDRLWSCVMGGGCEVEMDVEPKTGEVEIKNVTPLTREWRRYLETGEEVW